MFGYVTANGKELTKEQYSRYGSVYCGICRQIRLRASSASRLGLQYDMAFLALMLMSLYEPAETGGKRACAFHPCKSRGWVDNEFIRYAADMNVALAYYKSADDWQDDKKPSAKLMMGIFGKNRDASAYPRQFAAMEDCIRALCRLEKENSPNPDEAANCFGALMGELFVYREDMWAPTLREMGMALGRFIYLADAASDYPRDARKKRYNPYIAMGMEADWDIWDQHLILAMGKCTEAFEKLPLVQDKAILDNILYSGVWCNLRRNRKKEAKGK